MRPRLCLISLSLPAQTDIRLIKQVEYLSRAFDVTAIGYGDASRLLPLLARWHSINRHEGTGRRLLERMLVAGGKAIPTLYDQWFWNRPRYQEAYEVARTSKADVFLAADWAAIPIAVRAATNRQPVIFDADEYWPGEVETDPQWKRFFAPLITWIFRRYGPSIDATTTVSQPLAERYASEFGLRDISLVLNAPKPVPITSHPLDWDRVRLQHHGSPVPNRNLEATIQAIGMAHPRFSLELMLTDGPPGYVDSLQRLAQQTAPGRITFVPPVYPTDIVAAIMHNDIGLCIIPPVTGTYEMTLPNKILEAVCAGLAVITGPSRAMADFVREHDVGMVTTGFDASSIAAALNSLAPDDITGWKATAVKKSAELNADVEFGRLVDVCQRTLTSG